MNKKYSKKILETSSVNTQPSLVISYSTKLKWKKKEGKEKKRNHGLIDYVKREWNYKLHIYYVTVNL